MREIEEQEPSRSWVGRFPRRGYEIASALGIVERHPDGCIASESSHVK